MNVVKRAFITSLPVFAGYTFLGIGFGLLLDSAGYGLLWAIGMSISMYTGTMQYMAVTLLSGGASLVTFALTTLVVNARYLFYSLSMIDRYKNTGWRKPYLIFSLTDETYSFICEDPPEDIPENQKYNYWFYVSAFDHCYWIFGTALGSLLGAMIEFNAAGMEFSSAALFITVFIDQWKKGGNRGPALLGIAVAVICLFAFGEDGFIIPAMLIICALLLLNRAYGKKVKKRDD